MYKHYFLQMGLPFSLLIGIGISLIKIEEKDLNKIFSMVVLLVAIFSVVNLSQFAVNYRKMSTDTSYKIAKYIKENTGENDTLFVLGDESIIYFLADRKAATKYFDWVYSCNKWGRILQIGDSVLSELNKNKPKYIVYYNSKWFIDFYDKRLRHLENFMFQNYHIEKVIDGHLIYKSNEINMDHAEPKSNIETRN